MRKIKLVILAALLIAAALTPQTNAAIPCPPEPYTTCHDCFSFGYWTTYSCNTFCQNGAFRRTCTSCGFGCPA